MTSFTLLGWALTVGLGVGIACWGISQLLRRFLGDRITDSTRNAIIAACGAVLGMIAVDLIKSRSGFHHANVPVDPAHQAEAGPIEGGTVTAPPSPTPSKEV